MVGLIDDEEVEVSPGQLAGSGLKLAGARGHYQQRRVSPGQLAGSGLKLANYNA